MKTTKKPIGIKHRIREARKREERIGLFVFIIIIISAILVVGLLINSVLNQPSTSQPASSTSAPKAVIVDQLSLTYPNQTFVETATNTLQKEGYAVDYYSGEKVTVEFYRNLPTYGYRLIIFRVHSALNTRLHHVTLFTSELYSNSKYIWEQLDDRFGIVQFAPFREEDPKYFGIAPKFITQSMKGRFQDSIIIMMGCNGLTYTRTAEALIEKGAKVYLGWNESVTASHTDMATTQLLQHLVTQKQTIGQAIGNTYLEVGSDPEYNSFLLFYPLAAKDSTIQNTESNATGNPEGSELDSVGLSVHFHSQIFVVQLSTISVSAWCNLKVPFRRERPMVERKNTVTHR